MENRLAFGCGLGQGDLVSGIAFPGEEWGPGLPGQVSRVPPGKGSPAWQLPLPPGPQLAIPSSPPSLEARAARPPPTTAASAAAALF